jgi:hypothetical protein
MGVRDQGSVNDKIPDAKAGFFTSVMLSKAKNLVFFGHEILHFVQDDGNIRFLKMAFKSPNP